MVKKYKRIESLHINIVFNTYLYRRQIPRGQVTGSRSVFRHQIFLPIFLNVHYKCVVTFGVFVHMTFYNLSLLK